MAAYCDEVCKLEDKFDGLELNHVTRCFNKAADELAKATSGRKPVLDDIFVSDQYTPSIRYKEPGGVGDTPPAPDSGANLRKDGNAPPVPDSGADSGGVGDTPPVLDSEVDPSDPEVMEIDANPAEGPDPPPDWRAPYLNYLIRKTLPTNKTEGKALIQDIHVGACGHHAMPRTLIGNAFRQGFYWPMAVVDATHVLTRPWVFGRDGFILQKLRQGLR
ncbi:uncharacterized protein LOC101771936 [Setaria italica]|uniref:uncharacterized protein LOC101771936 n=1 Tax=Setaria italica TaxID=4555 RepID=UPI000350C6F4|nr:uncharacterized protein LOC101771936 [Setaria italica]